ncbi:hypothetical protein FOZ60_016535 [Perkinsus olseni]|uniref:Uncharacterized protein n=4 Tax=Perkinsus olseni TaxID=32597 RepID=A0A7J6P482_PEROL|nr:hypothetical protein FOZ60_016535 [Perkinsus olseni]
MEGFNLLGEVMIAESVGGYAMDARGEAERLEKIKMGRQKVLRGLLLSSTSWINEQVVCTSATSKARDISAPENEFVNPKQDDRLLSVSKPRHTVISVDYGGCIGLMTRPAFAEVKGKPKTLGGAATPASGHPVNSPRSGEGQEAGRYFKSWQGAATGDTALHMAVRVHDRLLVAALMMMGADMEARNGDGLTPDKALKFNPTERLDAGLKMGPLDPRIGGRDYLEGLYYRVAKPDSADESAQPNPPNSKASGSDYFGTVAAAEAQSQSLVADGTLWQEEILMSIQRFSAYRKVPLDAAQLGIATDIIATLCRQGAIEGVFSADAPRFKWLVLASEATRSRGPSRRRPREEEQQTAQNVWSESRVWMGKCEELYPGGPSRLLSLPEAAEQLSVAERSGGIGALLGGQARSGGGSGKALKLPTQRLLKMRIEGEKGGGKTASPDESGNRENSRGYYDDREDEILPIEGEILRYRGLRFGTARTTIFQSPNFEIANGDTLLHVAIRMRNYYLIRFLLACAAARGQRRTVIGLKNSEGVTCSRLSDMEGLGSLGELCPKMNKAKRNKKGLPIVELLLSVLRFRRPQGKQSGKLSQFLSLKKKYGTYK